MASKKAPRPVAANPSGLYIKLPVSPELAAAVQGHAERGSKLVGMLGELFESAMALGAAFAAEHDELARTHRTLVRSKRKR